MNFEEISSFLLLGDRSRGKAAEYGSLLNQVICSGMDLLINGALSFWNAYCGLDGKVRTLKRKLEELTSRRNDINTELVQAEQLPGKRRKLEVDTWLKTVEGLEQKVHETEQEAAEVGIMWRVPLVDNITELTQQVEELFEQGRFPKGLTLNVVDETRGYILAAPKLVGENFDHNLNKIWHCLMNREDVLNIGVYGMGGVGKTTLVGHIHDRLLKDRSLFDSVCWVTISHECNINKIQNDLAHYLCLDLSKERNEMERAKILSDSLKIKRSVIILDDIWKFYPLEKVGIALGAKNGCKLILTSRSKNVCDQMGCSELINVEVLSVEESWLLFRENLNPRVPLSNKVTKVAKLVAQECGGLPLGLTVLARCMRGIENIDEWEDALEELRESKLNNGEVEEEVFRVLRFSYDRLSDETVKEHFLNIALYPEDYEIGRTELIQYFMDAGLLGGRRNWKAECTRGRAALEKLLGASLLQEGKIDKDRVKMHDLVRDMVINMMKVQFMVKAKLNLSDLQDVGEWSVGLEKVSLMYNQIEEIPPGVLPRCPKLHTLLLGTNPLEVISEGFFEHMPALQVLDLSATKIKLLPSSACNLKKLTGLYLRHCRELHHLPSLEKLISLRTLDLQYSGIVRAPKGIEKLINLGTLNFSNSGLEEFPAGILPRLSCIRCLNMAHTAAVVEGEELAELKKLEFLSCRISGVGGLNVLVKHMPECLRQYVLVIDATHFHNFHADYSKCVVNVCNCQVGEKALLPKDVEVLLIKEAAHLRLSDLSLFPLYTFTKLKYLGLFGMRELRILLGMEEVEGPAPAALSPGIFSSLIELCIYECPKMKKLLCPRLLAHLGNLEYVTVESCDAMEEIIVNERDEEEGEERRDGGERHCEIEGGLALPKLRRLTLKDLPKLRSICRGTLRLSSDSIAQIRICRCRKLQRMPILLEEGHLLSQRTPSSSLKIFINKSLKGWWESLEWEHPGTRELLQPYVRFS